jgi:capsular polysaccharide biosynthesis protein
MIATYLSILRRRRGFIIAVAAVLAPLGFLAMTFGPDTYRSEASLLLGTDRAVDSVLGQGGGFEEPERRMATELELFAGQAVAARAAERLTAEGWNESATELSERVEAAPRGFSRAIEVVGTDTDPQRARELTDAFVLAFLDHRAETQATELATIEEDLQERLVAAQEELSELDTQLVAGETVEATREVALTRYQTTAGWLEEVRLLQAAAGSGLEVLSPASVPETASNAVPPVAAGALAVLGAVLLAAGIALLLDLVRDAVRTRQEAERLVPAPVLVEVPRSTKGSSDLPSVLADPAHPTMAAARALRLRFELLNDGQLPGRILIAGGATETDDALLVGAAFAAACGRAGRRALLVADPSPNLRLPALPGPDLDSQQDVRHPDAPIARMTALEGLWSAPAGVPRRAADGEIDDGLFDGFMVGRALDALDADFDVTVIVAPAGSGVLELSSFRRLVDRFALVCALGQTSGRPLRQLAQSLQHDDATIDGVVLTSSPAARQPAAGTSSRTDHDRVAPATVSAR